MQLPAMLDKFCKPGAPGASAADWFSPARFAALLALLIFALFPQVWLGLQTFVVRDYGFFACPAAHYQREAFWRGELPLWNPLNNCGIPFLAQWNTMPLYPPALLYLLLPLPWSLGVFCLLHLWFAGLGAYLLARRWTGDHFAAAFAGVVFAFNGFTLNLLMWPSHIATFAWMPWVVLLVERGSREGGRMIFLAALAGAIQMLGGGPETILFTWLLLAALWIVDCIRAVADRSAGLQIGSSGKDRDRNEPVRRSALRFPLIVLLVAALAAAQLLPFLDLASHSQRDTGYADSRWALPLRGWANLLVPLAFGRIWNAGVFFQHGQAWTSSYYLGMAAMLLAALALWRMRERRVWLLTLGIATALLFALGDQTWLVRTLRQHVPQLALMTYPVKFLILVAFLLPQLAALGLANFRRDELHESQSYSPGVETGTRVTRPSGKSVLPLGSAMLALIAFILIWTARAEPPNTSPPSIVLNGVTRAGFLMASVGLLLALLRRGRATRLVPLAFVLVVWLDLLTHEPRQNPTVSQAVYEPALARARLQLSPAPIAGESRAMTSPAAELQFSHHTLGNPADNLLVKRLGFFANLNLLDDVPKVNGFYSLYPREIGELISMVYGVTNHTPTGLLNFLGVAQVTSPGKIFEWEARTDYLPLFTAGQRPVFMDETNALRAVWQPDFNAREVVVLLPEAVSLVAATNRATARIIGWRFGREEMHCEVETDQPAVVVVAQTYYHRWRAWVDEQPAPVLRANFAFQAVPVPAGRHRVRLVYVDRAFQTGAALSLTALAVCLAGLFVRRNRHA